MPLGSERYNQTPTYQPLSYADYASAYKNPYASYGTATKPTPISGTVSSQTTMTNQPVSSPEPPPPATYEPTNVPDPNAIYQQAMEQAQLIAQQQVDQLQAALQQQQEAAAGYQTREDELRQQLEGYGQADLAQAEAQRQQALAAMRQDMINRGIISTSAYGAGLQNVENQSAQQLNQLQDRLTRERMDYLTALSGQTLGARMSAADAAATAALQAFQMRQSPLTQFQSAAEAAAAQREAALQRQLEYSRINKDTALDWARFQAEQQAAAANYALQQQQMQRESDLGYSQLRAGLQQTLWNTAEQRRKAELSRLNRARAESRVYL